MMMLRWSTRVLVLVVLFTAGLSSCFFGGSPTQTEASPLKYACNENEGHHVHQFCNMSLSVEARVQNLVDSLTISEKVMLLRDQASGVPRLGIPSYEWWSEGLHGVAYSPGVSFSGTITRATSFPQPILTAASFNSTLFNKIGQVVATEARAFHNAGQGGLTFWTPNINIFRDPRWGRGQETPGEDPYLTSVYAAYFVKGLQEDKDYDGLFTWTKVAQLKASACCKHYTAYDLDSWQGIERYGFDAVASQQDLDDTFNPPFIACIQLGQASGLMCSYNAVNGIPACADRNLLTTQAREAWRFDGYIVSDCDAVQVIYANHNYGDPVEATADALKAGMDVNCGYTVTNFTHSALNEGLLKESDIDDAILRSIKVQFRLGMFDGNPANGPYGGLDKSHVCTDEHMALALEAALQSIVLLKNDDNTLPFSGKKIKSLAVIGPNAKDGLKTMLGNYAGEPCGYVTPTDGLGAFVEKINYVAGCMNTSCSWADIDSASTAARASDATVIVAGLAQEQEREAFDRTDILLPGQQENLIMTVASQSKGPVVLVLMNGGGVDVTFARNSPAIGAIIWAGYPGMAGGVALAQIIFGSVNPGGKLPMTWYPNSLTSWPMTTMAMRPTTSDGYPGRTYRFYTGDTVFNFGDGLSYTKFEHLFSSPSLSLVGPTPDQLACGGPSPPRTCASVDTQYCSTLEFQISVQVTNAGDRSGSNVVMVYVSPPGAGKDGRPLKQLLAFRRITVDGGQTVTISLTVDPCSSFATIVDSDGVHTPIYGSHILTVNDQIDKPVKVEYGSPT